MVGILAENRHPASPLEFTIREGGNQFLWQWPKSPVKGPENVYWAEVYGQIPKKPLTGLWKSKRNSHFPATPRGMGILPMGVPCSRPYLAFCRNAFGFQISIFRGGAELFAAWGAGVSPAWSPAASPRPVQRLTCGQDAHTPALLRQRRAGVWREWKVEHIRIG